MTCGLEDLVIGKCDSKDLVVHDNSTTSGSASDGAVSVTTPSSSVVSVTTPTSGGHSPTRPGAFHGMNALQNSEFVARSSSLIDYPLIVTASQLLDECDDDSVFCGPPSDPEESGLSELRSLKAYGVKVPEPLPTGLTDGAQMFGFRYSTLQFDEAGSGEPFQAKLTLHSSSCNHERRQEQSNSTRSLVAQQGEILAENPKFVGVFEIGLEDDPEFCLVKRILGKSGCNMRRIAEECNAKVRLRGIGSGFLEGSRHMEANMPMQMHVSCGDYDSYRGAVTRVAAMLKELYKHYRRYARSRSMEVPDTKINFQELRRDDLGIDLLAEKAQRSPSERERDRVFRKRERDLKQMSRFEERPGFAVCQPSVSARKDKLLLPGGIPVPTTPSGRALAAKAGGAEAAAIVSAAARAFEQQEREMLRKEREERREQEHTERLLRKQAAANRALMLVDRTHQAKKQANSRTVSIPTGKEPEPEKDKRPFPMMALPKALREVRQRDAAVLAGKRAVLSKACPPPPPPCTTLPSPATLGVAKAALLRRVRILRARKQASMMANSLNLWLKAKPLLFMLDFAKKTRQIQRFMRWSIRRLAEVRTRVESDWLRLEREIFVAELRARGYGSSVIQGANPDSAAPSRHSVLPPRKPRRGAIAVDHDVSLVHMVPEYRRHATLRDELRRRRVLLLPKYEVWKTDMDLYVHEVEEWRRHREACKLQNARLDLRMPLMPPCPSHLPSNEELTQIIQLTWDEENNIKRPQEVPKTGPNAMAEALLRTATSTLMLWPKRLESSKATEDAEGENLSDDAVAEVRQLLALPVLIPIGEDSAL